MRKRPAGDVLHTGLVIDDDIAVSADILVEQGLEHAVDVAVAALALRAAHDEHVEIVLLRQRGFEAVFGIVRLCHALGDRIAAELRLRDLLADLAEGDTGFHAEDLVQIGIGIRVDDEQRTLAALDEGVDHHAADRRFSDAALSGDSNGIGHGETSFVQWGNCRTAEPPGSRIISSCCRKLR